MNRGRQTTILIHLATWAALFFLPLMSTSYEQGVTCRRLMTSGGVALALIVVFYSNLLWLAPRYYTNGGHRYYWLGNAVIILLTAVSFHFWMEACDRWFPSQRPHSQFHVGMLLRDVVNLSIVAAIATATQLASRWRKTEEARREAEAARIDAELKTLRAQINPHFLLNTLNNIYALTAFDTQRAQTAIQELSKMLRHLLYDNEQPTVPLSEEMEFLQNYINLMKIRLPKNVEVSSQFCIRHPQLGIAPVIFISLLENAFKHGVSPVFPSFIRINVCDEGGHIVCDIQNSNHPKTQADRSGHGIGLTQVQRRLDLAYPGRYTWQRGTTADGTIYQSKITIQL